MTERQRKCEHAGLMNVASGWERSAKEGNFVLVCIQVLKTRVKKNVFFFVASRAQKPPKFTFFETHCIKGQNLTCVCFVPKLDILYILRVICTIYTECPRGNVPDFGRVSLMLKYTDITQNTYIQS